MSTDKTRRHRNPARVKAWMLSLHLTRSVWHKTLCLFRLRLPELMCWRDNSHLQSLYDEIELLLKLNKYEISPARSVVMITYSNCVSQHDVHCIVVWMRCYWGADFCVCCINLYNLHRFLKIIVQEEYNLFLIPFINLHYITVKPKRIEEKLVLSVSFITISVIFLVKCNMFVQLSW